MNKFKGFLKASFMMLISAVLIVSLLFSFSTIVSAAKDETEITPAMQEIIDLLEDIPADTELITMEHKDAIYGAKEKYDALSDDEKIAFPQEEFNILSSSEIAIMPFIVNDIATRIEGLDKKLNKNDKDVVLKLYADYELLSEDAKSAISESYVEFLLDAVDVANGKATDSSSTVNYELIIIIALACLIAINLVLFIIVIIKLLCRKHERIKNE